MAKSAKKVPGRPLDKKAGVAPTPPETERDPVLVYVGEAVFKARKELGLTQLQLSKKAHCNATAVFMVESARQNMTLKSLMQIAAALNLQVGDLFPRSMPRTAAKLKEVAEVLTDTTGRIAIHLRTIDRLVAELNEEAGQ